MARFAVPQHSPPHRKGLLCRRVEGGAGWAKRGNVGAMPGMPADGVPGGNSLRTRLVFEAIETVTAGAALAATQPPIAAGGSGNFKRKSWRCDRRSLQRSGGVLSVERMRA